MSGIRKIVVLAVAAVALAGAAVGSAYALHLGPWRSKDLGPVIARVDGVPVYLSQAETRVQSLASVHGGDIQKTLGAGWQEKVLESLVDDVLIQEEAHRRGITVTDQEVAASLGRVQGMFQSVADFQKWLDSQHMDVTELERRIRLQALAAHVYSAVTADVAVTGDQIRAYYRSHRAQYQQADGTTLPLLQVRASIRQKLESGKQDRAFTAWLDGRRQDADVVVVLDEWWRNIS